MRGGKGRGWGRENVAAPSESDSRRLSSLVFECVPDQASPSFQLGISKSISPLGESRDLIRGPSIYPGTSIRGSLSVALHPSLSIRVSSSQSLYPNNSVRVTLSWSVRYPGLAARAESAIPASADQLPVGEGGRGHRRSSGGGSLRSRWRRRHPSLCRRPPVGLGPPASTPPDGCRARRAFRHRPSVPPPFSLCAGSATDHRSFLARSGGGGGVRQAGAVVECEAIGRLCVYRAAIAGSCSRIHHR